MPVAARLLGAMVMFLGLTGETAAYPASATVDLNMRTGPGTNYRVVTVIPRGGMVDVRSCSGNWCHVAYANRSGYASASYLMRYEARRPAVVPAPPWAPPPWARYPRRAVCDERGAGWAIGRRAHTGVINEARMSANARSVRVLRPGEFYTQDFQRNRLSIEVNRRNRIIDLRCG